MQNLIYPAVLGSILYTAVQVIITPLVAAFARWRHLDVVYESNAVAWSPVKVAFLLLVLVFYHCDYFYLAYTKAFTGWFFAADLVFVVAMYVTLVAINPLSSKPPVTELIAEASLVFTAIYFAWDAYEFKRSPSERRFYWVVLGWEFISFVALLGHLIGRPAVLAGTAPLLWILFTSTSFFIGIVVKKKRLFEHAGTAT